MENELGTELAGRVKNRLESSTTSDPLETLSRDIKSDKIQTAALISKNLNAPSAHERLPVLASAPDSSRDRATAASGVTSDEMLVALWLSGRGKRTLQAYSAESARLTKFLGGVELRALTIAMLFTYRDELARVYAPASVALALNAMKSLLQFGFSVGYLERNLGSLVEIPKIVNRLAERILPEAMVHRIINLEPHPRDRLILKLLYASGVRVSELAGLRVRDCEMVDDSGQITVLGKGSKTRSIRLSPATWAELSLAVVARNSDEAVFRSQKGGHLHPSQIWRIVKKAALRAGAPEGVSPHWMRHCHGTYASQNGCPLRTLQESMGHSGISTTGIYLHVRPSDSSARYLGI